jgi:type IV pilus assembly protein PilB
MTRRGSGGGGGPRQLEQGGADDGDRKLEEVEGGQRLGELLVKEGLVTPAQLEEALRVQEGLGDPRPLGHILMDRGVISRHQLDFVLDAYGKRPRLGEVLERAGLISRGQLEIALEEQKRSGLRLGEVLLRLQYVTEDLLRQALCVHVNVPFIDLDALDLPAELSRWVSKSYARTHGLVPVAKVENTLTVAMDDPTAKAVIEELKAVTGFVVTVVTSSGPKIQRALARVYDGEPAAQDAGGSRFDVIADERATPSARYIEQQSRRADSIVRHLLNLALEHRASDIHVETLTHGLHVRFRIDGVLQELSLGPVAAELRASPREVVSRIKVLGSMDIAERRRPQDGSFRAQVKRDGRLTSFDFRVSVVPGYYGESVVIRILDGRRAPRSIHQLGFSATITARLAELLGRTAGIILVTGPTGSGKSTTLYGALMTLYRPEIRILTAEDPIEYVYEHFSQSEVNERIGNTFAGYLRAFLRHDPEVMMIGEIRDEETAEMAFRAAQTGHLLLSTLHTNDAISAVTRLRDLRVDPNLIASSLLGVLSQRLVREVCGGCREPHAPAPAVLREFFAEPPAGVTWSRGRGCAACNFTGYKGRIAVAELWAPSPEDVILINKGASFDQLRESALRSTLGMADDVRDKLLAGRTTPEELIRTLPYTAIHQFRQTFS